MKIRALIQSLLLVVWALLPALQGAMTATPACKTAVSCSCCSADACHCAKTPEREPGGGSQPLVPPEGGSKQVSPPALQATGETPVVVAGLLPDLAAPAAAARAAWAARPVSARLLYCRFLM